MLGERLEATGCDVVHAKGDADLLIVQTAVESATRCDSILVGDDTDMLVLLCHHGKNTSQSIFQARNRVTNEKETKKLEN